QTRAKTVVVNSYWQLPARLFDDTEELSQWARAALGAAQRAALKKRPPTKKAKAPAKKAVPAKTIAKKRVGKKIVKKKSPRKKSSS
ncbi:MAG TPA: competence protein TfoX, partial [Bradyrhizobium sp.]|nr:competence protein TfoX [Bradyrhizobium sp.]